MDRAGRKPAPRAARRRLRRAGRIALALAVAIGLAPVAGALIPGPVADLSTDGPPVTVGLVQGPIHTDFLLPLDPATRQRFAFIGPPPEAEWLAVGWGARGFYTTVGDYGDLSAGAIWAAASGDEAVMHFQPVGAYDLPMTVTLSPSGYAALLAGIRAETLGEPIGRSRLAPGDVFFAAPGRFSLASTCNQWVGQSLRAAGRRFGVWTPTTWSVRLSLWWHADPEASRPR